MGKIVKIFFLLVVLGLIGIQFVKVDKTNPPVSADIKAPDNVKDIFKKSCYDCHSNETVWPWYSSVAPISWMIEDDVTEGRRHLNFSEWETYNDTRKSKKKEEIWDEVNHDEMPLKSYTYIHNNTKLDVLEKKAIREWATKKRVWE